MKVPALFFVLICAISGAACQQNSSIPPRQSANSAPSAAKAVSTPAPPATPTPVNAAAPAPEPPARLFEGKGVVTQIEVEAGWLEIDHEEIKGLMPAMRMQFNYDDRTALKKLKVGDKVSFVLEDKGGAERLVSLKKN